MVPAAKSRGSISIPTPSGCRQASRCTIGLGHGITISGRLVAGLVSSARLQARRQWGPECDGKTRLRAWSVQQLYRYSWRQGIKQCVASSRRIRFLAVSDGSRKNLRPTEASGNAGVSASLGVCDTVRPSQTLAVADCKAGSSASEPHLRLTAGGSIATWQMAKRVFRN